MALCEVCGNEYDKAFQISMPGEGTRTFDSFECAIHALAPSCEYCGVKVIGHGVEAEGHFYCCAHCASMAGVEGVADRGARLSDPSGRGVGLLTRGVLLSVPG
jgi:hypothetical protein